MYDPVKFEHEGRQLEVRAEPVKDDWVIRVFEGGSQASRVAYTVSIEATGDARMTNRDDLVEHQMKHAQKDVTKGIVLLIDR
jgi:hypothetical protein